MTKLLYMLTLLSVLVATSGCQAWKKATKDSKIYRNSGTIYDPKYDK